MSRRLPVTVHAWVPGQYKVFEYYPQTLKTFILHCSFEELDDEIYKRGLVAV